MRFAADEPFKNGDMELDEQGFLRDKSDAMTRFAEPEPLKHETIGKEITDKMLGRDEVQVGVKLENTPEIPMAGSFKYENYKKLLDSYRKLDTMFEARLNEQSQGAHYFNELMQAQKRNIRQTTTHVICANHDAYIEAQTVYLDPNTHFIRQPSQIKPIKPGDRVIFRGFVPHSPAGKRAMADALKMDERSYTEKLPDYPEKVLIDYEAIYRTIREAPKVLND